MHVDCLNWYDDYGEDEEETMAKDIIRPAIERKDDQAPSIEDAAKSLDKYISQTKDDYRNLDMLQGTFIELSTVIPYDSPSAERFIELLSTLRKLPHWRGFVDGRELLEASEGACNASDQHNVFATVYSWDS